jgi:hypothetical protein
MSASRERGKASGSPAAAGHPAALGASLRSLLTEETLKTLVALGAAVGAAVSGLGFVSLRTREALLGLSPGLTYPTQEWLATGCDTLGSLVWRGASVLVSDHPVLQRSAWALFLVLLGVVLAARSRRRPALLVGALAVSALLLVAGSGFYRVALAASSSPAEGPSRGFLCAQRVSRNLADRAAFETCSWLVNDGAVNEGRRRDLDGLLAWLLAACLAAAVAGSRAPLASRRLSRLRRGLVGVHALLALLLLYDLPRAHAVGTWGLRYPLVQIQPRQGCDLALAQATLAGSCWAFDVSANAETPALFLRGGGCPARGDGRFVRLGKAGAECLIALSSPRVIVNGPTPSFPPRVSVNGPAP